MKHKKRYFVIILMALIVLFASGCGKEAVEVTELSIEEIEAIVAKHYDQDFDYTRVRTLKDGLDGDSSDFGFLGEYQADPYQERLTLDLDHFDSKGVPPFEETYSGDGDLVLKETVTEDAAHQEVAYAEQVKRPYYPGYGEDVTYTFVEETKLDRNTVQLYRGEYTVNAAEEYGNVEEEIPAVITQEYYFDPSEKQIVKVVSYYDNYRDTIRLVAYMHFNEVSYKEAKEHYMDDTEGIGAFYSKEVYTFLISDNQSYSTQKG